MRSLFLKIFLWFWATVILTGVALILTFVLQPDGVPAQWHVALTETARIYGKAAVGELERGDQSKLRLIWKTSQKAPTSGLACLTNMELKSQGRPATHFGHCSNEQQRHLTDLRSASITALCEWHLKRTEVAVIRISLLRNSPLVRAQRSDRTLLDWHSIGEWPSSFQDSSVTY